jgi:hypothetical protein
LLMLPKRKSLKSSPRLNNLTSASSLRYLIRSPRMASPTSQLTRSNPNPFRTYLCKTKFLNSPKPLISLNLVPLTPLVRLRQPPFVSKPMISLASMGLIRRMWMPGSSKSQPSTKHLTVMKQNCFEPFHLCLEKKLVSGSLGSRVYRQRRVPLNNWEDYKDALRRQWLEPNHERQMNRKWKVREWKSYHHG